MRISDYGERLIDQAIRAGKIPELRREHYRQQYAANGGRTEHLIANMEPIRVVAARLANTEDALPRHWFRELSVAASAPAATEGGLPEQWFPEVKRSRELAAASGRSRVKSVNGR